MSPPAHTLIADSNDLADAIDGAGPVGMADSGDLSDVICSVDLALDAQAAPPMGSLLTFC